MDVGKSLSYIMLLLVSLAALIIYVSLVQTERECVTSLQGNKLKILGNLKRCVDACWRKSDFGNSPYSEDCYVMTINSSSTITANDVKKFIPNCEPEFSLLEENVEHKIKIRYDASTKKIRLILT